MSMPMSPRHALMRCPFPVLLALLAIPHPVSAEDTTTVESVVLFNTGCARCHEGECSGRLSFHLPREEADQHILRHGGVLPPAQVRQLYDLLRHMKEECAFSPLPLALVRDGVWGVETLALLYSPRESSYFLPLGTLEAGPHRILLQGLGPKARPCVELIDTHFDFLDGIEVEPSEAGWELRFRTEGPTEVFMRLKAPGATPLTQAELTTGQGSL